MEGTTDCVVFLDRKWRFTFLNRRAAAELSGGRDLAGATVWEAFPELEGTVFGEHFRRAVAMRCTENFEGYYAPLSAWYEVRAVPVDDGLTVFFRNINERLAAEEALRESERQLATVFGQTMVGIIHRHVNGQVLMVNQRFCNLIGRSKEEVMQLSVADFTYSEDARWNLPLLDEHIRSGEPFQVEKRFIRPDGSLIWCAVNVAFVRDEDGNVVSMIAVAKDINERKAAEERARKSRDLFQVVIDSVQDLIFVKDRSGRFVLTNRQMREACGPLEGKRVQDRFPPQLAEEYEYGDRQVMASGKPFVVEEIMPVYGESRTFQTVKVPWRQDDKIIGIIGVSRDLTDRLQAEAQLRESKRQLATLIDNLPGLVYRCSLTPPWPFSFISEGAELLTGYSAADFMSESLGWADIVHPDDFRDVEKAIASSIEERRPFSEVYRIIMRSGEVRWVLERGQCIYDTSGAPMFLEGIINDITVQKHAEERLRWGAHHDSLTQLPNRMLFHERLDEALIESGSAGRKVGLLLIDLDHLKEVNDSLGHDAGDLLLRTVAKRLSASVRDIDTVARNGGDEFGIILPGLKNAQELETLTQAILESLRKTFTYAGRSIDCRASIGASIWPDHAEEASELLKQADIALYSAKAAGRGKLMVFEQAMRTKAQHRAQMRSNAHAAISEKRIEPFYQPKVRLDSGTIAGFEALLRWRSPWSGIEAPSSIEAAFDDPALAIAIGQQMLDLVLSDMRRWLDGGLPFGHVAVNASAAEFRSADFAERMLEGLRAAGIPTSHLELEVTETVFLGRGAEYVERALRTLSAEGVRIALDDFGTGYASLSHLKQFPVDIIKIDRSFVADLANDPVDAAILQTVLHLGKCLNITTVAEGIETDIQAAHLRAQGCDLGQGYLFGKAVPKGEVPGLVSAWERHPYRFASPAASLPILR